MADTAIIFIVEGYELEFMSAMLSASLKLNAGPNVKCYAYVKQDYLDNTVRDFSKELYAKTGVEVRGFSVDPKDYWATPYPHGNKIIVAMDKRPEEHTIFLDTDMICTGEPDLNHLFEKNKVSVLPENRMSWGGVANKQDWKTLYDHFGLELSQDFIDSIDSDLRYLPYYNAGFVAWNESDRFEGQSFPELWYKIASEIDHDLQVSDKRPWLDQVALPIVFAKTSFDAKVIDKVYNYSGPYAPDQGRNRPIFSHYHTKGGFYKNKACIELFWKIKDSWGMQYYTDFANAYPKNFAKYGKRAPKRL